MANLKHEIGGWIFDITRKKYERIDNIKCLQHDEDDQEWCNHGAPSEFLYSLTLGTSFTHYLSVSELDELYPYIGTDVASIEVLFGKTK